MAMPISAENQRRYPSDWPAISRAVKEEQDWRCAWCPAEHGKPHPETGSKVVLTCAHLNHVPEDVQRNNLVALCQRCHNRYDQPHRQANAQRTRRAKLQTVEMFEHA